MKTFKMDTLMKVYTWYVAVYSFFTLFYLEELSGILALVVFSYIAYPLVVLFRAYTGK